MIEGNLIFLGKGKVPRQQSSLKMQSSKKSSPSTSRTNPPKSPSSKKEASAGPVVKYHFRSFGKPAPETVKVAKETEEAIQEEKIAEAKEKGLDVYAQSTNFVFARSKKVAYGIRKAIAKILNIPADGPWEVTSYEPEEGLYMINYNDNADPAIYGKLRGVCVDIINKAKVAALTSHVNVMVADQLLTDDNSTFIVAGKEQHKTFEMPEAHITRGFEGPQIIATYHNGNLYLMSRKQIQSGRSRWPGTKMTVEEAYYACGGPSVEDLFDTTKKFSPWGHRFRVVHPVFLMATRQDISKGYLVYEGATKFWETTKGACPYPLDKVDADLHEPEFVEEFPDILDEPFIYHDLPMTIDEANNFLRYGWLAPYDDWNEPRLRTGESIVIHSSSGIYQVRSTALNWRISIVGDTPNHFLRLCQLSQDAVDEIDVVEDLSEIQKISDEKIREEKLAQYFSRQEAADRFFAKYADLPPVDLEQLFSLLGPGFREPLYYWPIGKVPAETADNADRLQLIWSNLLIAMPVVHQAEGIKLLNRFIARRTDLVYFFDNHRPTSDEEQLAFENEFGSYFQTVLQRANQTVAEEAEKGSDEDSASIFHQAVQKILREYPGDKLHKMLQNVSEYRQSLNA